MTNHAPTATTCALPQLPEGMQARIAEIRGESGVARRLLSLGLRVGSIIRVTQQRRKGVVVACAGNRVALGGSVADKMLMQPLDHS